MLEKQKQEITELEKAVRRRLKETKAHVTKSSYKGSNLAMTTPYTKLSKLPIEEVATNPNISYQFSIL